MREARDLQNVTAGFFDFVSQQRVEAARAVMIECEPNPLPVEEVQHCVHRRTQ